MSNSNNMGDLKNQGLYTGFEDGGMFYADYTEVPADYDPRTRGWYKDALSQNWTSFTITEPYVDAMTNAATAEESAAASQELTRQANVLNDEVNKFSL